VGTGSTASAWPNSAASKSDSDPRRFAPVARASAVAYEDAKGSYATVPASARKLATRSSIFFVQETTSRPASERVAA
jgi:hypothetical protein